MMYNKDKFQEMNEEKSHSRSSVDEGCAIKKLNTIWKNSNEEHATSGHFGGNTKCEQLELFDFAVIADLTIPGDLYLLVWVIWKINITHYSVYTLLP